MTIIYGYDFKKKYSTYRWDSKKKKNILIKQTKCIRGDVNKPISDIFRSPGIAWTNYYAETENAESILNLLIGNGFDLDKNSHCTKKEFPIKNSKLKDVRYRCSIDWVGRS